LKVERKIPLTLEPRLPVGRCIPGPAGRGRARIRATRGALGVNREAARRAGRCHLQAPLAKRS
jgi:hypothetical protein